MLGDTRRGFSSASLRPPHLGPGRSPLASWPSCVFVPPGPSLRPLVPSPSSALRPTCVLGLRFPLPTALAGPPSGLYGSVRPRPGGRARVRHGLTVVGTYGHVPGALSPLYVSKFVSPPPLTSAAGFASVFPSSTPVLDLFPAVPSSGHSGLFHRSVCGGPRPVRAPRCRNLLKCTHSEFQRLETETRGPRGQRQGLADTGASVGHRELEPRVGGGAGDGAVPESEGVAETPPASPASPTGFRMEGGVSWLSGWLWLMPRGQGQGGGAPCSGRGH